MPHPINKLSPEILQEIFRKLLGDVPTESTPVPFTLSQVCKKWRQIVLASPFLWAEIRIPNDFPEESYDEEMAKALPIMFERSGSFPLSISYDAYDHQAEEGPLDSPLIPLLLGQAHRWDYFWTRFSYAAEYLKVACSTSP
ncbi:hypothetical protein AMATHDRAFT_50992 [Amanita thiersii Skay4041]|uniref:F-box domain-containing protein n=1 Tax=Amanita thiersii Skay4041 TaxID=703135 RepID=A0A2A9NFU1_9AGAR|nr:hypothetical protein AMATHDRAFT_50992 [Amanita thiersii Skay4041]